MEPMEWILLGSGVMEGISALMQSGNTSAAAAAIKDAVDKYGPEAEAAIQKNLGGPAAMSGVYGEQLAPEAAAAQKNVLQRLQQISEKGYTPEEQAALNRIQQQSAAQAAQQQAALRSSMARRGVAGSGQELAMNLSNLGQQSANQYQAGLDVAANAQRRALQALGQQGQFGQSFREQAFGEASRRAGAEDERRRLNAQLSTNLAESKMSAASGGATTTAGLMNKPAEMLGGLGSVGAQYAIGNMYGPPAYGQRKKPDGT